MIVRAERAGDELRIARVLEAAFPRSLRYERLVRYAPAFAPFAE